MTDKYQLQVQLVGYDKTKPDMAVCELRVIAPDGTVAGKYIVNSGPYGNGALPGLQNDFSNTNDNNVNAVFNLENPNNIKRGEKEYQVHGGNSGFFINILTPGTGRAACGIHPDRGATGTLGCLGMVEEDDKDFQNLWNSIPKGQRPDKLLVMKPSGNVRYIASKGNSDKQHGAIDHENSYLIFKGSAGEDVGNLQSALKVLGFYEGEIDSNFKNQTRDAVVAFQKKYGLKVDGIVGPETMGKMNEISKELVAGVDINFERTNVNSDLLSQIALNFKKFDLTRSTEVQNHRMC